MTSKTSDPLNSSHDEPKHLSFFERYLSIWVALCMGIGIFLGKQLPELTGQFYKIL